MGKNKYIVTGISFLDKSFLEAAKQRASELDMSLSKYVTRLIKEDIAYRKGKHLPMPNLLAAEEPADYPDILSNPDNFPRDLNHPEVLAHIKKQEAKAKRDASRDASETA